MEAIRALINSNYFVFYSTDKFKNLPAITDDGTFIINLRGLKYIGFDSDFNLPSVYMKGNKRGSKYNTAGTVVLEDWVSWKCNGSASYNFLAKPPALVAQQVNEYEIDGNGSLLANYPRATRNPFTGEFTLRTKVSDVLVTLNNSVNDSTITLTKAIQSTHLEKYGLRLSVRLVLDSAGKFDMSTYTFSMNQINPYILLLPTTTEELEEFLERWNNKLPFELDVSSFNTVLQKNITLCDNGLVYMEGIQFYTGATNAAGPILSTLTGYVPYSNYFSFIMTGKIEFLLSSLTGSILYSIDYKNKKMLLNCTDFCETLTIKIWVEGSLVSSGNAVSSYETINI